MRHILTALVIAASSATLLAATMVSADAQTRKKKDPRTLVIQQRSFLDSGKIPLFGSMNRYVIMDTQHGFPAYYHQRGRYGAETLPGRFGPFQPN